MGEFRDNMEKNERVITGPQSIVWHTPGLILGFRPATERRSYKVTPSLIDWTET